MAHRALAALGLLVVTSAGCLFDPVKTALNSDERDSCGGATTHVRSCCPGFNEAMIGCQALTMATSITPDWTTDQMGCVRRASCDEIRNAAASSGYLCGWTFRKQFLQGGSCGEEGTAVPAGRPPHPSEVGD
jgi:hypothetical protein